MNSLMVQPARAVIPTPCFQKAGQNTASPDINIPIDALIASVKDKTWSATDKSFVKACINEFREDFMTLAQGGVSQTQVKKIIKNVVVLQQLCYEQFFLKEQQLAELLLIVDLFERMVNKMCAVSDSANAFSLTQKWPLLTFYILLCRPQLMEDYPISAFNFREDKVGEKILELTAVNGRKITKLDLSTLPLTDEDLVVILEHCPNLTELSLRKCDVLTDDFFKYPQAAFKSLKSLDISYCNFSSVVLGTLAFYEIDLTNGYRLKRMYKNFPNLQQLNIENCPKITKRDVYLLLQMRPAIEKELKVPYDLFPGHF